MSKFDQRAVAYRSPTSFLLTLALAIVGTATSAFAADVVAPPAVPSLLHVLPAGGKRGGDVEVAVQGQQLGKVGAIRFSSNKLTAAVIENPNATTLKLKLTIAADADLGEHELRVITPGGISNALRFVVSDLPELRETEPNNDPTQAQKIETLPLVLNGQITGEDRDYVRFTAKAGQTLVCEVQGRRLRPFLQVDERVGWFDPCLSLLDASGKELRFEDDFRTSPDPVLIFSVPQDGEYVLCVRDTMFRGRPEFIYRLVVGPVPYITHYFPPGGTRGSDLKLQLFGANVPESGSALLAGDTRELLWRATSQGISSNAIALPIGDAPEAMDTEPNDSREQAQRITTPLTFNGRIDRPGDADCVAFTAQKGQRWILETTARGVNSPLDAVLQLLNDKGNQVATNDDLVATSESLQKSDARIDYTIPADGDYVVRIKDFLGRGGPEFTYRLSLTPPKPDFELRLRSTDPTLPNPRVTTVQTIAPFVPAGGSTLLHVEVTRRDGFNGDIALSAIGLSDGFQFSSATLAGNQTQAFVTLTAPDGASPGTVIPLQIVGSAKVGESEVRRTATALESHSYITDTRQFVTVRDAVTCVAPASPIRLTLSSNAANVVVANKLELKVNVQRQPGITGPVTLSVSGLPPNVAAPNVTIPENQSEATLTISAAANAPAGLHNLVVTGTTQVANQPVRAVASAFSLTVAPK